ncbi:unnamed protein product [Adineta ricciae]|uniref:Helix-turn-helix domain-containing protein n=1 Tax=Adineta ricciae TaxID=249248 RepID=A0A815UAD5_ADIRI|nr:unnamed protein product [Adineta ricciae]CAF1516131.1 unnamed protein product [Adineta ricciae]
MIRSLPERIQSTNLLREMRKEEYLTQQEYRHIKPLVWVPAKLYAPPKTRKANIPRRPIVSCTQSDNYRIGKFLASIGTHFLFNKKFYDQRDGVSMGTPTAVLFAEIFMENFEEKHPSILLNGNNTKLLVWHRYVDDTFTIFKHDVKEDEIRQLLNTLHQCIKFTAEAETNCSMPFLDVLDRRENDDFDTTVCRKKRDCLLRKVYKTAPINVYVNRAHRKCSTPDFLNDELQYIQLMASFNNYPPQFVEKIINIQ